MLGIIRYQSRVLTMQSMAGSPEREFPGSCSGSMSNRVPVFLDRGGRGIARGRNLETAVCC